MKQTEVIAYVEDVYEEHPVSEGTGTYSTRIGKRNMQATVTVEVDLTAIAKRLGAKAARSKGGKAVYLNGLVVVKRVEAKPV